MLKRKIYGELVKWKEEKNNKCLIVSGARQVGKTFIVRAFAAQEYDSFIELNFLESPSLKKIFDGNLDIKTILTGIRLYLPEASVTEGRTLLFLDEIQECPNAVTALKFLAQNKCFDVIASGSALGMTYNRVTSYPVGYVDYIDMYALDFMEFLWAIGVDEDIIEQLRTHFREKTEVPSFLHERMMQLLRQYMAIGGMPEVVSEFTASADYAKADAIQQRIHRDYLADIARYSSPDIKLKAEKCYESIPLQLAKENHKFQYKTVEKNGNARKFETSLDWLFSAHMAYPVMNVSQVEYPLKAFSMDDSLRVYPSDIGLLTAAYGFPIKAAVLEDADFCEPSPNLLLRTAKGGLYEALAADMLIKTNHRELHFYRNEAGTVEMEFLLENEDGVIPIEIKAGRNRTRSLDNLLKKENLAYGYKFANQNVGCSGKKITMPLYMLMFI